MADERIVTSIVANSDFSNLIADVQRVTSSLFKLQQELAGSNRALAGQMNAANAMFNQNMLKTGQFSSHFVSLTSDVEKFGKNLDGGRLKLKDYFRVYQDHAKTSGGLIRDLAKQQVQLQNAVLQPLGKNAQGLMQYNVHIPRGLDLVKNKTSLLKQEFQIMNKVIQDGGIQLINWGKNTQWAGRQLTMGLTLPLVAFGKAAADAFKVADQELTRLTKVYGDVSGTSAQELLSIRKEVATTAKELSSALGVNFSETIALAADIAATGKTGNELLSAVSETTRLAVLGEVDRQEAMKATLAIQTAFKQNTEELAESINFLNAVENQTSTTLNDLVTAIPKAGPVVKSLGGDIQDLALYLTAMREGGINASESANALKSGLASLINPTKQTVGLMKGFGIDVLGMVNKNAGDTTSLLLDLQSALDQLDPLSKAQAIEQMFGKFQFARISALLNNLGKEGSQTLQVMELMGASVAELEAVAGRELSAVTESAAGKYKRAVEALKAELATTGDGFLNIATKLINVLNKILDFGAKLPDPIKKLMTFAGAFTAIIGPVIMLTGVLANFFGYIIKGLGHFKALFKSGEGFKLLTPEIIAARNASSMLSDEFYSDAKAADTLSLAIKRLNEDLKGLQLNAANATSSTNSLGATIATAAGTPIMRVGGALGTPRITDPNHPLVGPQTRAAAHLNPRDPNNPSSIFGLTLQPVPVNRRIGATPQILMSERLPDVPGLTNVGGISTGVVAAEHAKFAALMATLGVQSQQEIDALKKTIGLGGQVSRELLDTFGDILPITSRLTANAAAQSASIVAELKAGTINVQQARAQIIAVNAQLEAMMGADISAYAAGRGRTIDLTRAPLINQPVVDAAGKPNIRGAYRSGIFLDVMESLGRATGTKTFGGPYSIETTRPIQRNMGGAIFYNDGDQVPGPNVNADVVPAMLTPGEFVIRRDVAQQDPDGMRALNEGRAMVVPTFNTGGKIPGIQYRNTGSAIRSMIPIQSILRMFPGRFKPGLNKPEYEPKGTAGIFGGNVVNPTVARRLGISGNTVSRERINARMRGEGVPPDVLLLSMLSGSGSKRTSTDEFLNAMVRAGLMSPTDASSASNRIFEQYAKRIANMDLVNDLNNPIWSVSDLDLASQSPLIREAWRKFSSTPGMLAGPSRGSLSFLDSFTLSNGTVVNFNKLKGSRTETFYHSGKPEPLTEILSAGGYNSGGMIPGYNGGGKLSRASLLAKLGAKFKFTGKHYSGPQALETYSINAMDMNGGRKYFGDLPISDKARGSLYNSTIDFFNSNVIRPDRGAPEQRGFGVRHLATAFPTIASMALRNGKGFLTKEDIILLSSYAGKSGSLTGSMGASLALHRVAKVFRANRGGSVPGYTGGGRIIRAGGGYNVGGLIPSQNGQKYTAGGTVKRERSFYGDFHPTLASQMGLTPTPGFTPMPVGGQQISQASPSRGMLGMMGFQAASFGGMYAGQSLGSRFGSGGAMAGSMLGSILPMMMMGGGGGRGLGKGTPEALSFYQSKLDKSLVSSNKFSTSLVGKAAAGSKFSKVLMTMVGGLTKLNLVLAGVTLAVGAGIKIFENYKKTQELSAAEFGMTSEAAEKAGLEFTNYGKKIKDAVEAQKLLIAQNKINYQSMASAGTPFKMTIAEYNKLRKEIKETMSAQVEMLNAIQGKDVTRVATQLKTQFISMGLSAEEAAKRVYTLLQMSDKAYLTVSVMSSKTFGEVINAQTAAISALKAFDFAKQFENTKDQAAALNTALMAIDSGIEEIYDKTEKAAAKKKQDFDSTKAQYNAEKTQLDAINSKVQNQKAIGDLVLDNLAKQNPLIRQFATAQDTVVSLWQKMRIAARGYTADLNELNVEQTQRLYDAQIAISQAVEKSTKTGILKKQYDEYNRLYSLQKDLEKATKGQSVKEQINARDRIKALDKEIKKINDKAEARKKALREEAQAEDISLRIQQQKLQYERAVSAGDFGGAAEAQIELRRLQNEQQVVLTEQQIEERRLKDVGPIEREKERLEKNQSDLADKAALAAESLESVTKKADAQKKKIDEVNIALTSLLIAKATGEGIKGAAATFIKALEDSGVALDKNKYVDGGKPKDLSPVEIANQFLKDAKFDVSEILAEKDIVITANGDIIIDGVNLKDNTSGPRYTRNNPDIVAPGKYETNTEGDKKGRLTTSGSTQLVKDRGYVEKDFFMYNGVLYKVQNVKSRTGFDLGLGAVAQKADGGKVSGPGTGTSDSIPAYLSNGEYVIKEAAVNKYGVPFFDAINAQKFDKGGEVKKQNWFQKYVSNLTKSSDSMPAWARDPLGTHALMRKLAGQGRKGDGLNAALMPLSFMGLGAGRGVIGAGTRSLSLASGASRASLNSAKAIQKEKELMSKITVDDILNNLDEVGEISDGFYSPIAGTAKWGPVGGKLEGDWAKFPEGVPDDIYQSRKFVFPGAATKLSESTEFIPYPYYGGKTAKEYLRSLANSDGTFSPSAWSSSSPSISDSTRLFNSPDPSGGIGSLLQKTSNVIKYKSILNDLISQKKLPPETTFTEFMKMLNITAASQVHGRGGDINEITRAANILYAQKYYGLSPEDTVRLYRTNVHGDDVVGGGNAGWHSIDRDMAFGYGNTFSIHGRNMVDVKVKDMPNAFSLSGYTDEFGQVLKPSTPVQFSKELPITPGWDKTRIAPQFRRSFLGSQSAYSARSFKDNLLDEVPTELFVSIRDKHGLKQGWLSSLLKTNKETGISKLDLNRLLYSDHIENRSKVIDAILDLQSQTGIEILAKKFADGGYVNPAYSSNMSMPSYKSGVKYLYGDTIAQLHKGEAVIPEHMNPFNPNASAPLSPNYSINNSFTINAADGMDIDALTNKVAAKVEAATARALIKTGTERNISRRYN